MDEINILDIFSRTIKNCHFYEDENNIQKLYSEIGCARGIFYCLENLHLVDYTDCDDFNDFFMFVKDYLEELDE